MNEQEVEAQLYPDSEKVEVLEKAIANTKALERAIFALSTIALEDNLQGAVAKNALEEIAYLMGSKPILVGNPPYDHAGPDY